jgi:SAM-dependent methyltransferase
MAQKSVRPRPPIENINRIGAPDFDHYLKQGELALTALANAFERFYRLPAPDMNVLDFGCGVGRVAFPFVERFDTRLFACDVDPTAVAFLAANTREFIPLVSNYDPPLPFADGFLDLVYSVSVWTHLPAQAEAAWLTEMKRVTRSGAMLFITTAGHPTLAAHHGRGMDTNFTSDELKKKGFVFFENKLHKKDPGRWPGVRSEYGLARHDPDYVRRTWSKYFTVVDVLQGTVGKQDLVVLKRGANG